MIGFPYSLAIRRGGLGSVEHSELHTLGDEMKSFCSALIVDADCNECGWEICFRFGPDSLEEAYTDLSDSELPSVVGEAMARILISERDRPAVGPGGWCLDTND